MNPYYDAPWSRRYKAYRKFHGPVGSTIMATRLWTLVAILTAILLGGSWLIR